MRGLREEDVLGEGIDFDDIKMLLFQRIMKLKQPRLKRYFMDTFLNGSRKHTELVKKIGWKALSKPQRGSWSKTENIDMKFIDVREKLKYLKYGYGRATDQLNIAIKSKLISRKEALKIVKKLEVKLMKEMKKIL